MKKQKSTISLKTTPEKAFSFLRRNPGNTTPFNIRHNFYQNSFFQSKIIEWNNLDSKLWNSENFSILKNNIFKLNRPKPNSFFNCGHLKGIRLITRLCLEFSHLSKHKIKCNFQNCLIHSVTVIRVLNRPLIFFSIVLYIMIKEIQS